MRAVVFDEFGPPEVLKLKEIEKPVTDENHFLVRVVSTSVNFGDMLVRNFREVSPAVFSMPALFWLFAKLSFGFNKPKVKILGSEFSGLVENVGNNIKQFRPGDEVFGYLGQKMGAYAEYIALKENDTVTLKPSNISFEQAAAIPYGAIMAYYLTGKAGVKEGEKVIVVGASGSIGLAAVQFFKLNGAIVTAVCSSEKSGSVKKAGADFIIDYRKQNFKNSNDKYDLIFDVKGIGSYSAYKNSLTANGRIFFVSFKMKHILSMLVTSLKGNKKVLCRIAPGSKSDLESVKNLVESGKFRSFTDKSFAIEMAAEAHRYAEEVSSGKVVLNFN